MPQPPSARQSREGSEGLPHTLFVPHQANLLLNADPSNLGRPGNCFSWEGRPSKQNTTEQTPGALTSRQPTRVPTSPVASDREVMAETARTWPGRALRGQPRAGGRSAGGGARTRHPRTPSPGRQRVPLVERPPPSRRASRGRCGGSPELRAPRLGGAVPWANGRRRLSRAPARTPPAPSCRGRGEPSGPGHAALPGLGGIHPSRREALPRRPHEGATALAGRRGRCAAWPRERRSRGGSSRAQLGGGGGRCRAGGARWCLHGEGKNHRIVESIRLGQTSEIVESNL